MAVLVELLRFLAANEDLPRVQKRYPGYDRDTLGKLINAAADRIEAAEEAEAEASGKGKKKLKVRKASAVEEAASVSAAELDAAMNESKAERERKKRERQVAQEQARVEEIAAKEAAPRIRLYCDGASRGNPGLAGAGAVIINEAGHIVAKIGKFLGENTNNFAEYTGLLLGLRRAKTMGIRDLEVLADSELMVRQLNGDYAVKAENLKPLYDEAKSLMKGFDRIDVRHIPREENGAADSMSNRAIDERL